MRSKKLTTVCHRAFIALLLIASYAHGREANMSYLDNGVIRLGVDLDTGGAITYLSRSGPPENIANLVNSFDFGRQIQMSYYSGPIPFTVPGKQPKPQWSKLGWNPIQVGDAFGHPSKVLEHRNSGNEIYVKCVPMQWPLENVPGECTFECWLALEGSVVHARCRLNNARSNHTQYSGMGQELPAIYTNGPWYKLMTYRGDRPFAGAPLSRIEKTPDAMWSSWIATENWAALVDDHDFGLGIWQPEIYRFIGGFAGKPGVGGPHDNPTGYIAPTPDVVLDWNVQHDYHYDLIVATLPEIRRYVYTHSGRPKPPKWIFQHDRQGWIYRNAIDTGWPIDQQIHVLLEQSDPQLISPVGFWPADQSGVILIDAALHSSSTVARIFWRNLQDNDFNEVKSLSLNMRNDGQFHQYRVDLWKHPHWQDPPVQLRLDPVAEGSKGDWIRIRSIVMEGKEEAGSPRLQKQP